ncbi:MAG: hypothetical protein AAF805_04190 [Planctomycetota bacterium]
MNEEANPVAPLGVEEYIEQSHFFATLAERMAENVPVQEVLSSVREETLATTKLPLAIDFLLSELRHAGAMGAAMTRLAHYFTPLQAYLVGQGEDDRGRFDLRIGLQALALEAAYRAGAVEGQREPPSVQGLFLYQFETICRNRLSYDRGLSAIAADPAYPGAWRDWVLAIRHQVGMVDIADLIYVQSEHARRHDGTPDDADAPAALFGDREGRIALANRRKDPLYLFNSLHRQLGYPEPPRPLPTDDQESPIPAMARRLEQLEKRVQLLEEEQRGGFDLSRFYEKPSAAGGPPRPRSDSR